MHHCLLLFRVKPFFLEGLLRWPFVHGLCFWPCVLLFLLRVFWVSWLLNLVGRHYVPLVSGFPCSSCLLLGCSAALAPFGRPPLPAQCSPVAALSFSGLPWPLASWDWFPPPLVPASSGFFADDRGGGKDVVKPKILIVLEHFPMIWHIIRIFTKKYWSVVNNLPLQPGKSKFNFFFIVCPFCCKTEDNAFGAKNVIFCFTIWLGSPKWVYGHPHIPILYWKNTLYCTMYSTLYCTLYCTLHST